MNNTSLKKYIAEFVGTAVLVIVGVGAIFFGSEWGVGAITGPIALGLALMILVYTIGGISGAHVNPAVSLGVFLAGKMKAKEFGFYVLAQTLGALLGAVVLFIFASLHGIGDIFGGVSYQGISEEGLGASIGIALLAEIIFTFIFIFTILAVVAKAENKSIAGIVIGLTLTAIVFAGSAISNLSVNPAVSLGLSVFNFDTFGQVWLFLVGPMIGAALAGFAAKKLFSEKSKGDDASPEPTVRQDAE